MKLNLSDLLGTLLLATWITSMLYAVIIKETWFYFKTFPQDRLILKIHVGLVVLGDTASLVGTRVLVQYFPLGPRPELPDIQIFCSDSELALLDIQPVADGLGGACEATAAIFIIWPDYSERHRAKATVITWLTSSAATDVFISLALVWQLFSIKTSFSQTEGTIKRLIRQTVQTGSASSIIAICTLIAFLKGNSSNVEALLAYLLEKIYVLTLLTNLNMRKLSHANTPFSGDEEMGKKSARINPAVTVDAIQVRRSVVRMDDSYRTPIDGDSHTNIDSDSNVMIDFEAGEVSTRIPSSVLVFFVEHRCALTSQGW
ncbi:hypothetical protein D9757_009129 [Collybiopsis confluens]|uniref:DUF6534 domain-containing protein n=1 Tax=Collybiopsis confluens TaxID=2823264 RepID=A0A8H5M2L1_9AGAR|nr:hypothetical protein D9757_009129 [Collybiopsis confluens]